MSKQFTSDLKLFCQKENVTLFMTLLTAYQLLLYRYTNQEDIAIGTPIAGRPLQAQTACRQNIHRANEMDVPQEREISAS